jgi:EmrB/QacA subfamily drug resistance transporter
VALLAAIMGSFVVLLDSTVVNVALPAVERDLGGGLAGQQWVLNAYLLALGSLILIGGSLADVFGERRVFTIGVGGFGAVSLVCALAPSIEVLIAGRVLQGIFGALLTPAALAVIVSVFTLDERGAAIGSWTAWTGIAAVVGPLAGGQIVDSWSWRWIFAINVPFVLATLVLVALAVPAGRGGTERRHVDVVGAVLCALGLAGPVFALIRQPELGWGAPGVILPLLGGVAVFAAFLLYEARTAHPMLELSLFRRRNFTVANAETLLMYAGLSVLMFFLVLFLQQVAGYDALESGFALIPLTVIMFALSRQAGRLADRLGPRLFMGAGPLVAAAGMLLMLRLDADVDYVRDLLPAVLVFSLGLSITVAPLTATVLADADEENAGIASGVNNAIARVGGLLGVAALGAVVAGQFTSRLDDGLAGQRLSAPAQRVVAQARERTLVRLEPAGLPVRERALIARVTEDASVQTFRVSMGIAGGLLVAAGVIGLVGIANPRRELRASECAGGQICGAPHEAGQPRRAPGLTPAPTPTPAAAVGPGGGGP